MTDRVLSLEFKARPYQVEPIEAFRAGIKHHFHVWHRRAGKDRMATFIESMLANQRVGLYWHALPEYRHARRVIWDQITPEGTRLIDVMFPSEMIKSRNEQDMKIELHSGSIWQLVGADNFDSLVGANPVHVTLSEYALMHPKAREFIRPILAENNGSELMITTPRGFNHAHALWQYAIKSPLWSTSLMTIEDTGMLPEVELNELRNTMPEELFRQEYLCDWSAANMGAILGRYVEIAEREGRIMHLPFDYVGGKVDVSCDIGFRDTAAFWFWQRSPDGYALIDYTQGSGLDAEEWGAKLREEHPYDYGTMWMPHDARNKTFATRRSAMETFMAHGFKVKIVPELSKSDRINAARMVMPHCRFDAEHCAEGLTGLREWSYEYNENNRAYSKEPKHDWASHPGDAFSYGAIVMREHRVAAPAIVRPPEGPRTIEQMIRFAERSHARPRARI